MPATRAFIAIPLPAPLRHAIAALQQELTGELPGIRWSAPDNMHLTLRFLGEVPADLLENVKASMLSVKSCAGPFSVGVRGVGAFPDPRRPRVLWLGLTPAAPLLALHRCCEAALTALGIPGEARGYTPHLTLGRWHGRAPEIVRLAERLACRELGQLQVAQVVLYASRLLPAGARHTPLFAVPLSRDAQLTDRTPQEGRKHG